MWVLKFVVFWNVMPSSEQKGEDVGSSFPKNITTSLPKFAFLHLWKQNVLV